MKTLRGSPEEWMRKEAIILKRIAACSKTEHVWCRGEVQTPQYHAPAVVIFDRANNQVKVLAPYGVDDEMEIHDPRYFAAKIPHASIVREILEESETNRTI
jgi:hypothetical protein